MTPDHEPTAEFFKRFFVPATTKKVRCIDERKAGDQNNGVQIQGATSGIVDAYKAARHLTEDAAWDAMRAAGIPIDGHVGVHGCGYNNQIEHSPWNVGASESVAVSSRIERVETARGNLLHYEGDHTPKHATINYMRDRTLNTNAILDAGEGTFNLDAWAIDVYAKMLKLSPQETETFRTHIIDAFKQTVMTLTSGLPQGQIAKFIEIR